MSVSNRKAMLRDFAEKNGMFTYKFYVDKGVIGTRKDVRKGLLSTIDNCEDGLILNEPCHGLPSMGII